jgi:hypothetical protein
MQGFPLLRCNTGQGEGHYHEEGILRLGAVFEFVCRHCDRDGPWDGDAESVAADFQVSEDQSDETLSDLADRGLIEKLVPGKFAIVNWTDRDKPAEEAE